MKRLLVVVLLVLVVFPGYRLYGGEQTGTGRLTLPQPVSNRGEKAPVFKAVRQDGKVFEISRGRFRAYILERVPRLFLIKNGTIELVQNDHYPQNEGQLREELDRVLPHGT